MFRSKKVSSPLSIALQQIEYWLARDSDARIVVAAPIIRFKCTLFFSLENKNVIITGGIQCVDLYDGNKHRRGWRLDGLLKVLLQTKTLRILDKRTFTS